MIDEDGRVKERRVDESSGHRALDEAAMAVADVYQLSPALYEEAKVPVWVSFAITFQVKCGSRPGGRSTPPGCREGQSLGMLVPRREAGGAPTSSLETTPGRRDMRNRSIVLLGIMCAFVPAALAAQTDVSGDWNMTFQTEQGDTEVSLTLEQDGEKLTGSITSDQGTVEFEGTISDDKVKWVLEIEAEGQFLEITIDGTVDGDAMTGYADFGGFGGGDWTATRQ